MLYQKRSFRFHLFSEWLFTAESYSLGILKLGSACLCSLSKNGSVKVCLDLWVCGLLKVHCTSKFAARFLMLSSKTSKVVKGLFQCMW